MSDELPIEQILLWPEMKDVKEELDDPRFATRQHGSRATYALRCSGPLCSKRERDRARRRNEERARTAGREYSPSDRRMYDRDEILEAVIAWHKQELAKRRSGA